VEPHTEAAALLDRVAKSGMEFIQTEGVHDVDGMQALQMGQGQHELWGCRQHVD